MRPLHFPGLLRLLSVAAGACFESFLVSFLGLAGNFVQRWASMPICECGSWSHPQLSCEVIYWATRAAARPTMKILAGVLPSLSEEYRLPPLYLSTCDSECKYGKGVSYFWSDSGLKILYRSIKTTHESTMG